MLCTVLMYTHCVSRRQRPGVMTNEGETGISVNWILLFMYYNVCSPAPGAILWLSAARSVAEDKIR